ncbi:hypothetical protein AMS68_001241 [Peltaster fructicola]|uniref:CSC1/OSCA1-like 7TM region domain-containing protein n=1 Tax=Peltaster fructicola TaxID=286661 RepID=A0A6H0XLX1_9PEZI|nr:hypothetical protein AMS68_001241 [Peltaster fructicola]
MEATTTHLLLPRQTAAGSEQFLQLLANPFAGMLAADAFVYSLAVTFALTALIALLFCVLRPYNSVVYAPRAKHADSKHAPPPVKKGLLSWIPPLFMTKEHDLVEKVGLDAAVFMRFARMMRNMFTALSIVSCAILIPVYVSQKQVYYSTSKRQDSSSSSAVSNSWLTKISPLSLSNNQAYWAMVVCAWLFDIIICGFLWWNYRAVFKLRRTFFDSPDYQRSLHARTLLLTDIPTEMRTDDGITRITENLKTTHSVPRAAIARNVKDLPDLIEEHEKAVRELEAVLAKYLKNPDKLPLNRPVCRAAKADKSYSKGQKVDAIEYWTARIKELEIEVKQVRESIDKRNPLSYGFASYENIPEAHAVAYVARKQNNKGVAVRLAPKPNDLVWKNLKLTRKERRWRNFINNFWVAVLTVVWIVPNILIAVFLANLSHLGLFWPAFNDALQNNKQFWAIVQGVLAPAITSAFYLFLPAIFRRLATSAGDVSKTSRERHVMSMLYGFFVLNNLVVVSVFAAFFGWIAALVNASKTDSDTWSLIKNSKFFYILITSLNGISPYWLSYQVQRNLGAAVDLSQIINLAWGSFSRRFLSPTPRQHIELSAPQPFDYAGYYNYYLFYATVAVSYAVIQPLILPVTALYFLIDSWLKKYLILYVFITKYESGGMFWRALFNRIIFMAILGNVVAALVLVAFTSSSLGTNVPNIAMLCTMAPLPILLMAFKFYCLRAFDDKMHFYQTGKAMRDSEYVAGGEHKSRKHDRVSVRFGHPALYKPLMTPMVSSKSQHLLKQLYTGRTSMDDTRTQGGYSDMYMDAMDSSRPGKSNGSAPFEIVNENEMDFEHFKNRPEFREEGGGDGALFGRAPDFIRPGTPSSIGGMTRTGTFDSSITGNRDSWHARNSSADSDVTKVGEGTGHEYPRGYHQTPSALREHSPAGSDFSDQRPRLTTMDSKEGLVNAASGMGHSRVPSRPYVQAPYAQALTPGSTPGEEETSYEYFRRGRQ